MSHAEKCPVCNGDGDLPDMSCCMRTSGTVEYRKPCHGCGGKGWVTVEDEVETEIKFVVN